jgi:hypothetical protein
MAAPDEVREGVLTQSRDPTQIENHKGGRLAVKDGKKKWAYSTSEQVRRIQARLLYDCPVDPGRKGKVGTEAQGESRALARGAQEKGDFSLRGLRHTG